MSWWSRCAVVVARGRVAWSRGATLPVLIGLVLALPGVTGCGPVSPEESAVAELVAQADAAPTPVLDWAACEGSDLAAYECATARVPLDYAQPTGPTIELAVLRQAAADPEQRLGTLFAAAGGPGNSGFDRAARGPMFPGEVSSRFDVVTFDQRGVGRSTPVRCFADDAARSAFWAAATIPPISAAQQAATTRAGAELAEGCARHTGALLSHLTTVDAARDLDLLRRAVGDDQLTFEGGSYASYLGVVYGALFGDRVRAMQLNSLLDPVAYTGDGRAALADTAVGTEEVLTEFLRMCAQAGASRCPFAARRGAADLAVTVSVTAEDLRVRDETLLARLAEGPVTVGAGPGARTVGHTEAMQAHATLLYDIDDGWPALARLLTELERGAQGDPRVVTTVLAAGADLSFLDAFTAISCADYGLPRDPARWPAMSSEAAAVAPVFGPFWLYLHHACASWPAPAEGYPQRHPGPWTLVADKPALLLNNRFDPVTPSTSAQRAQQALVNARLVVVSDGYGHVPQGDCVTGLRERYLVDLRLPAPGATCAADHLPFGLR